MRNSPWTWIIVILIFSSLALGCKHQRKPATPSVYTQWRDRLEVMLVQNTRAEDVSMLLGTAPTRCEPVAAPGPHIGVRFLRNSSTDVASVIPNGPAYKAGIHTGDSIIQVNKISVYDPAGFREVIENAREGVPLELVTSRGATVVVPKLPKTEQCYWDVAGGQVASSYGGAHVNQYGGTASSRGSSHAVFFRASCRIYDGFLEKCNWNWQE